MGTSRLHRRRWSRITGVLGFLGALFIGGVALPASPASANAVHGIAISGTIDIKDDDAGSDDWCRGVPFNVASQLDHTGNRVRSVSFGTRCDEVRIEVVARGELLTDERMCNVVLDVYLYEGRSGDGSLTDLDGHAHWAGEMLMCLNPGNQLFWDVLRVDNTAEPRSNDHGWVRNLTITHQAV